MTTRRTALTITRSALPVLAIALALGACVSRGRGDSTYRDNDVTAERYYPERVHYREAGDTVNVFYYDERRPDVVVSRRVYREDGGRTYYIERERDLDRRYYYDDSVVRTHRHGDDHTRRDSGRDRYDDRGNR